MRVKKTEIFLVNLDSRLPFRYGIAVMKGLPHCVVRVHVEDANGIHVGVAADNFAPKWFTKNPATSFRHDSDEMLKVIEHACESAEKAGEQTTVLELRVAPSDLGKVIGKQGRTARSIRTLLGAAGMKLNRRFTLEILE